MKKKSLFLLLVIALMMIIPLNANAFQVNPAGLHCSDDEYPPNGVANGICYVGSERPMTFITQNGDTSINYFCLSEHKSLGPKQYNDAPAQTYTDTGFACAVHNLLSRGEIQISDLSSGYFSFGTVTPDNTTDYTLQVATGKPLIYTKIQTEIWNIGPNATCTPYTENVTAPTMSLSAGAMTLTSDNNYYYSRVTVTKSASVQNYLVMLENQPVGTIVSTTNAATGAIDISQPISANEFYVLVPASATDASFRVKARTSYDVRSLTASMAKYVPTSDDTNQDLGRLNLTINTTPRNVDAQTQVAVNPTIDFKVCKKDSKTNNPMSGVKFSVRSSDNSVSFELTTGADGCAIKNDVKQSAYIVTEVATPNGYVKANPKSMDCTTTNAGSTCLFSTTNTPITLKVKKLDDSGEALVDAKMQILDKDGNVFDEWTSVLEDHIVNKNIPFGKYTLREQEAPAGYVIATEIEFEIKENGYVIGNETKSYGDDAIVTVTMIDKVTKVSILKVNAETGEPLVGAVLRIEKEDGTVVQEEWTTDGTPKVFTKMPVGTYYLVEVSAPEGYILQEERQPFTISQSSADQEIIIENHKVPNTAANKSALLISFAMLDIALGISIILYVKKRKATE